MYEPKFGLSKQKWDKMVFRVLLEDFYILTGLNVWDTTEQHPLCSSTVLEGSCCNSKPPVGIMMARMQRQSLIHPLILYGTAEISKWALCRIYFKGIGGRAPAKSFDGLGSK
jgi:hypothetical protein